MPIHSIEQSYNVPIYTIERSYTVPIYTIEGASSYGTSAAVHVYESCLLMSVSDDVPRAMIPSSAAWQLAAPFAPMQDETSVPPDHASVPTAPLDSAAPVAQFLLYTGEH